MFSEKEKDRMIELIRQHVTGKCGKQCQICSAKREQENFWRDIFRSLGVMVIAALAISIIAMGFLSAIK